MNSGLQRCRAAVAVEFAIILPLLVLLVFGITELGRALYQLNTLTKATTSGARYLARVHNALEPPDGESEQCSENDEWSDNLDEAKKLVLYGEENIGENAETLLPNMSVTFRHEYKELGTTVSGCVVIAESGAVFTSIFGDPGPIIPFTDFDAFTMNQKVEERYIGE